MKGGAQTVVEPHRHSGVFIARGKEDALVSKNMVPGGLLDHPPPSHSHTSLQELIPRVRNN